jgi:large-conductance mechanosensitive channel
MVKKIIKFFDKLEDKIRGELSHWPILYALIGGVGIVLFWRGIWHAADEMSLGPWASIIISLILLLMTGLFVSFFIGHYIIFSGIKQEKKIEEKEEAEIEAELDLQRAQMKTLIELREKIEKIGKDVDDINSKLQNSKTK